MMGNHDGITGWLLPRIHVTHNLGRATECGWGTGEGGMNEWGEGNRGEDSDSKKTKAAGAEGHWGRR